MKHHYSVVLLKINVVAVAVIWHLSILPLLAARTASYNELFLITQTLSIPTVDVMNLVSVMVPVIRESRQFELKL
jgi:hypothetical protein